MAKYLISKLGQILYDLIKLYITAHGITDEVLHIFSENSIDTKKCHVWGYRGASVMHGIYNGVQENIKLI